MSEEKNKSFEYRIIHDRDFVIEQHRKMWRYIANEVLKGEYSILLLKLGYIEKQTKDKIKNNCFLCNYASRKNDFKTMCTMCPIVWKRGFCCNYGSEYNKFMKFICMLLYEEYVNEKEKKHLIRRASKLAYNISELPERKEHNV